MATKVNKWYKPSPVKSGWRKDEPMATRRRKALKAHKNNPLITARSLQALANVTTDKTTETKASADAKYFYKLNQSKKR